ncbi:GNAT family N-acetyltransferase [Nocardioides bruguierae]|uniref:GNAT family N-acetyltransferase n=1 Tax=Nocardioides bruguierae TaxID=2945102 RepID=A0A9X2DEF9_9ACTN|nr:GNAT family protein [Nocardioides bruguierae]MCM0622874.1 GNAT family N-acetyltransferase [Nocardioides bruguierae]
MTIDAIPDRHDPVLRPIQVSDVDRIHEWASREEACRFQAWGPNTPEETAAFVTEAAATWVHPVGSRVVYAAETLADGVVGVGEITRCGSSCREIAYAVHVDLWGRGLGTQVARLLVSAAFADPSVERVQATCDPRNHASAAVLRHAGLIVEGTIRHSLRLRDGWRDSLMHSILRDEWDSRSAEPVGR